MAEPDKYDAPDGYDKLEAMAAAADSGDEPQIEAHIAPKPEPPPPPEPSPNPPEPAIPDPQDKGRERDPVTGKFLKKPVEADKSKDEPVQSAEVKVDSEYEKAKKEETRQKSLLANFEAEKKQAREELAQREAAVQAKEQQIQRTTAQQRPEATLHGHTAREYYDAAQAFRKEGDHENALKCLDAVGQIQRYESQYHQQAQAQATDAQFKTGMESYIKDHPEFEANSGTPENKMMEQVLAEWPELYYLKEGFARGAKIASRLILADSANDFKSKLETAEKEITSLRGKTQPAAGAPSAPAKAKNILDMSQAEAEAYLARRAEQEDAA